MSIFKLSHDELAAMLPEDTFQHSSIIDDDKAVAVAADGSNMDGIHKGYVDDQLNKVIQAMCYVMATMCWSWSCQCRNVSTDTTSSFGHGSIDLSNILMKYTVGFHVECTKVLRSSSASLVD